MKRGEERRNTPVFGDNPTFSSRLIDFSVDVGSLTVLLRILLQ